MHKTRKFYDINGEWIEECYHVNETCPRCKKDTLLYCEDNGGGISYLSCQNEYCLYEKRPFDLSQ